MSFFKRLSKSSQSAPGPPKLGGSSLSRQASNASSCSREADTQLYNGDINVYQSPTHGLPGNRTHAAGLVAQYEGSDTLSTLPATSRLSKTFPEIMHDGGATQCLLQYLRSRRAGHLLQFWLDAQSFQATTWSRLQTQQQQACAGHHRSGSTASACESVASISSAGTLAEGGGVTVEDTIAGDVKQLGGCSDGNVTSRCGNSSETGLPVVSEQPGEDISGLSHPRESCERRQSSSEVIVAKCEPSSTSITSNCDPPNSPSSATCDSRHVDSCQATSSPQQHPIPAASIQTSTSTLSPGPPPMASDSNHGDLSSSNTPHSGTESSTASSLDDVETKNASVGTNGSLPSPSEEQMDSSTVSMSDAMEVSTGAKKNLVDKLRKSIERDAVRIYSQYISKDAPSDIGISDKLRNTCISKICREDGQVDPQCFVPCQEFILEFINKEYYEDFMQSEFHCKHQVDVLTTSSVLLSDILYNESAIVYFMEYMEQEKVMTLLQCWLELDSFQQHLTSQQGQYDPQQAQNDAMVIYEKYFSLQAKQPLGFSDEIRFQVEGNICREEGPLPDCFDIPKQIILTTMDKVYLQQYLQSDLYYKYLSDLISTVQTAQDLPPVRRKRTESDASSEKSFGSHSTGSENIGISSRNTLLAADTSGQRIKKAINKINDDMRIDETLFNPDSLWQRGQAGNMSFGKVDDFGRFISEFDPEPDQDKRKKGGSFFKKKKEKEKDQEQMALQIAQMIISDITTTTSVAGDPSLSPQHVARPT